MDEKKTTYKSFKTSINFYAFGIAEREGRRTFSTVTDVIIISVSGCCYSNSLKDSHNCVERAMHHNCPVCFEFLFDTTKDITVLRCGHTIHLECVKEMEQHFKYSCPVCSKSYRDMSRVWEKLDREVASTPMPPIYLNKMVWILCNDCGESSEVNYHILAHKCLKCNSYNTRQTRGGPASCSSDITETVR
ncbi:hypothetical protein JRO89_XS12G0021300 [Xanthoceras sorbifolium]|uniref:RING-type domain-containing protein n=1 Tax=Xanthoceras sorbifolium TaxID=99658 RepID=A0ABQ8HAJ1_9ROSI|nr:hypothetical protein JRO89_XS12G0021300 [Xanthoceras sorbifolium]